MSRVPLSITLWVAACLCCLGCRDQSASPARPANGETDGAFATVPDGPAITDREDGSVPDSSKSASPGPCSELCVRVEAAACPSQKPCLAACQAATAEPSCGPQYVKWVICAAQQPAALFACDRRGQAALDASQCAEELKNFGDCLLGAG